MEMRGESSGLLCEVQYTVPEDVKLKLMDSVGDSKIVLVAEGLM